MRIRDVVEEVRANLETFQKLMDELRKRKEELEREVAELMRLAGELRLLEEKCFLIGKSCSIKACYKGVSTSRGVLALDGDELVLYEVKDCDVKIVKPETEDLYEALLRLRDLTAEAVKQLEELLKGL